MAGVRDGSVAPATPPLEPFSNDWPREMVASFRASGRDRIRRTEGQDRDSCSNAAFLYGPRGNQRRQRCQGKLRLFVVLDFFVIFALLILRGDFCHLLRYNHPL